MEGTWLDSEWYELCDAIWRFKELLRRRGIRVVERVGYNGGSLRIKPRYCIYIRRNDSDAAKLVYLIHEFVHFELGHRGAGDESRPMEAEEIEAHLVSHVVNWMFYLEIKPGDCIYEHTFAVPSIYNKGYQIGSQLFLQGVFDRGRRATSIDHGALTRWG